MCAHNGGYGRSVMDVTAFISPLVAGLITAVITGFTVYVTLERKIAVVETKIDNLAQQVEKHNSIVERTYRLEEQVKTLQGR